MRGYSVSSEAAKLSANRALQELKLDLFKLFEQSPDNVLELTQRAGLNESIYYSWRSGTHSPTLATLIPMVNVVGFKICVLKGGIEQASDYAIVPWICGLFKEKRGGGPVLKQIVSLKRQTLQAWCRDETSPRIFSLMLVLDCLGCKSALRKFEEQQDANSIT